KISYMKSIGDRIRERRRELKLTQKQVADRIGVSSVAVGYWERDENAPAGQHLLSLAAYLAVSPDWILKGGAEVGNTEPGPAIRRKIPLISSIQAGKWGEIVDNFQPGDAEDWHDATANI